MSINSKNKGKKGELEVANYLKKKGLNARRTQQYSGTEGTSDIVCEEWPDIHIEVKRNETLNIEKAMQQSINDSKENEIPIVIHRKNREKWKVTMTFDDFIDMQNELNHKTYMEEFSKKLP